MSGSIYIATTEGVKKGLLKIGMTTGDPFERIKQWSSDTGSPGEGLPLYIAYVDCDPQPLEARIHQALKKRRTRGEWFHVELETAIKAVYESATSSITDEWAEESYRQTLSKLSSTYRQKLEQKLARIEKCIEILLPHVLEEEIELAWDSYELESKLQLDKRNNRYASHSDFAENYDPTPNADKRLNAARRVVEESADWEVDEWITNPSSVKSGYLSAVRQVIKVLNPDNKSQQDERIDHDRLAYLEELADKISEHLLVVSKDVISLVERKSALTKWASSDSYKKAKALVANLKRNDVRDMLVEQFSDRRVKLPESPTFSGSTQYRNALKGELGAPHVELTLSKILQLAFDEIFICHRALQDQCSIKEALANIAKQWEGYKTKESLFAYQRLS